MEWGKNKYEQSQWNMDYKAIQKVKMGDTRQIYANRIEYFEANDRNYIWSTRDS